MRKATKMRAGHGSIVTTLCICAWFLSIQTSAAADGSQSELDFAPRGKKIRFNPSGYEVVVPRSWRSKHLRVDRAALDAVKDGAGEWDTEYAQVCNSIFDFKTCAAHLGSEGWGNESVSFIDLQVRVYLIKMDCEDFEGQIVSRGNRAVGKLTNKSAKAETATVGKWRRVLFKYPRFYIDYGGTAHVDIRYRRFSSHTVAFAFLYTEHEPHADTIKTLLSSVTPPSDDRHPSAK